MGDEEELRLLRKTNRDETALRDGMIGIWPSGSEWVEEDGRGFAERDAVLGEVPDSLGEVPLIQHHLGILQTTESEDHPEATEEPSPHLRPSKRLGSSGLELANPPLDHLFPCPLCACLRLVVNVLDKRAGDRGPFDLARVRCLLGQLIYGTRHGSIIAGEI